MTSRKDHDYLWYLSSYVSFPDRNVLIQRAAQKVSRGILRMVDTSIFHQAVGSSLLGVSNSMTIIQQNRITWDNISIAGILKIDRLVAEFQVECPDLPNRYLRVKIFERANGNYNGRTNVCIKSLTGDSEWISGLGKSIDEALEDTLLQFMRSIEIYRGDRSIFQEPDFEWAACEDF